MLKSVPKSEKLSSRFFIDIKNKPGNHNCVHYLSDLKRENNLAKWLKLKPTPINTYTTNGRFGESNS
ncbi:hypothetical protein TUM4445_17900 [Shewanella sp. MBTL60-112-B2]|nr:hypothetical protein TUM4444_14650 [Shewanella sp. MBTL60-112-B1]GIU32343.1 hypothetical protein TUM4445_17900 [Shewanella sp. MBTL60-112-B2]